jgi:hypothetical protein
MKFAKWIVMGSGGIVLAVAALILISPKAAHALAATLVQITNTTANPVPVFNADHKAYQSLADVNSCGDNTCTWTFQAVPAGYRLVAENLSGNMLVPSSATKPPVATLGMNSSVYGIPGTIGAPFTEVTGTNMAVINGNFKAYANAGTSPYLTITANWGSNAEVTLTGYLENCAVTGCP